MNSIGQIFRITTFGESHGPALGGIIDGMPAGIKINLDQIQNELDRRRPGQSAIVTSRNEADRIQILSGLLDDVTTGTPIGFTIQNTNQHSSDYDEMRHIYRPSHADYTYSKKYGLRDHRGGGRSSARATASIVAAGAFARQALLQYGIKIYAYTSQVGTIAADQKIALEHLDLIDSNPVRCPDPTAAVAMESLIKHIKTEGDTIGGIITGLIKGCPTGLGEPIFDKLQSRLASAMMSINAAKGFDYGMGFDGCSQRGSEMNDTFQPGEGGRLQTSTNHSGGIQGGITNGQDIYFRVAFKPVATLLRPVETVNDRNEPVILKARGRHDPCVLPRAVPIVESMAAITLLDMLLLSRATAPMQQ